MVTLTTAENALKTLYLGVVSDQLNTGINPLLAKFKQSTSDVWGKEIRKLAPYGINGGIGAGTEEGDLPAAAANNYAQFVLTLKNLYGTIELSDKAIRASASNSGAFVNLLNAEMEGLLKASTFNFGRMLYGDGSGVLGCIQSAVPGCLTLDGVKNCMEGMVIDVLQSDGSLVESMRGVRITAIDRAQNKVYITGGAVEVLTPAGSHFVTVQGSYNLELTGLKAVFDNSPSATLYGLSKSEHRWLTPQSTDLTSGGGLISDIHIQKAVDYLDETAGSRADFIVCSSGVKRAYQEYMNTFKQNIDVMNLEGGYKALSFGGIPLTSDRFVDKGTMYILNAKEFTLHQLCDWRWLEGEDGRIIKQKAGKPVYGATLVKYADLICDKPIGQAVITGITEQ